MTAPLEVTGRADHRAAYPHPTAYVQLIERLEHEQRLLADQLAELEGDLQGLTASSADGVAERDLAELHATRTRESLESVEPRPNECAPAPSVSAPAADPRSPSSDSRPSRTPGTASPALRNDDASPDQWRRGGDVAPTPSRWVVSMLGGLNDAAEPCPSSASPTMSPS